MKRATEGLERGPVKPLTPLDLVSLMDQMYQIKIARRRRLIPPGELVRLNARLLR